jgi:hypothetical protein
MDCRDGQTRALLFLSRSGHGLRVRRDPAGGVLDCRQNDGPSIPRPHASQWFYPLDRRLLGAVPLDHKQEPPSPTNLQSFKFRPVIGVEQNGLKYRHDPAFNRADAGVLDYLSGHTLRGNWGYPQVHEIGNSGQDGLNLHLRALGGSVRQVAATS